MQEVPGLSDYCISGPSANEAKCDVREAASTIKHSPRRGEDARDPKDNHVRQQRPSNYDNFHQGPKHNGKAQQERHLDIENSKA